MNTGTEVGADNGNNLSQGFSTSTLNDITYLINKFKYTCRTVRDSLSLCSLPVIVTRPYNILFITFNQIRFFPVTFH